MYILEENILPIPQKLKSIRKYLDLKQEDLTDGKINRSLISYIESGKVELTRYAADIITNSIKKVLKERAIPLDIDVDYLMSDEKRQTDMVLGKYLEKLEKYMCDNESDFTRELNEIEDVLRKWDIPEKKGRIHEIIGDFYFDKLSYNDSYINYIKSLESYNKINDLHKNAQIISKIGRCCIGSKKYSEAIKFNDYAIVILNNNKIEDEDIYKRCLFNNALAYRELDHPDQSLAYLTNILETFSDINYKQKFDILILMGICHLEKGDYNTSKQNFEEALSIASEKNDLEMMAISYANISALYEKKEDLDNAIKFDKEALKIREKSNDRELAKTILKIGKRYRLLNQYDLAEKYLLRGLKEADRKNDLSIKIKIYVELIKIYILSNEHYLVSELIDEMRKMLKEDDVVLEKHQVEDIETFLLIAIDYLIDSDIVQSKELLEVLLKKRR